MAQTKPIFLQTLTLRPPSARPKIGDSIIRFELSIWWNGLGIASPWLKDSFGEIVRNGVAERERPYTASFNMGAAVRHIFVVSRKATASKPNVRSHGNLEPVGN